MGTVFHKKELLVLLQDFYCLTGLRAVVFDSFGMEVSPTRRSFRRIAA